MSDGTMRAAPPQLSLGPYLVDRELGRGSFGVVYLAHHFERPEKPVALKVVESQGNLDRLLVEPEILSKLRHTGIVALEDYFVEKDRVVIALEFIEGQDLKDLSQQRGQFSSAEVREFLRQMAAALEHAHAAGVLHRDIKLPNILVERRSDQTRYVLTDFGISRIAQGIQTTRRTGGTYQFMAPEQLRGRPGPQSDLWALGVVAYRLLTGQLPFPGQTLEELSRQIFYSTPVPPSQIVAGRVDEALEQIIFELLDKSPNDRIASAKELLERLGQPTPAGPQAGPLDVPAKVNTYELRLRRSKARYSWLAGVSFALLSGPYGILGQVVSLAGVYVFYRGQIAKSASAAAWRTLAAWFVIIVSWGLFWGVVAILPGNVLLALLVVGVVCSLVFLPLAMHSISRALSLQRDLALRQALTQSASSPDECLALLKEFVEVNNEDIGLHQKYIEALLAGGRAAEAVVEAKVLLENDAYNLSGNLLLAQAYFDLQLYRQCQGVCDAYLAITGYCFEFADLKAQCLSRVGAAQ